MRLTELFEDEVQRISQSVCCLAGLREDFAQEMRLALLTLPDGQTTAWYLSRAKSRALHWLERHLRRRRQGRVAAPSSDSLGWELVARLPELFDQDRAVLAANLGWE